MPKVLLFDLDQTLLNRQQSLLSFLNWQINFYQLVPQVLKPLFIQRFIELDQNGKVWKDAVYQQIIIEFDIQSLSWNQLLDSYIHDFNKFAVHFEHANDVILKLHQAGYQLGLISNGKSPFQANNFHALGLTEYFECIIISEAVNMRKPAKEIFMYACDSLTCLPQECIFIGDDLEADILGAKRAGMHTIHFQPNGIQCSSADQSIQHYDQLEQAISAIEHKDSLS